MKTSFAATIAGLILFALLPWFSAGQYVKLERAQIPFWRGIAPFNIRSDSVPNAVSIGYQPHMGRCMFKDGRSVKGEIRFVDTHTQFSEEGISAVKESLNPDGFILRSLQSGTLSQHGFEAVKYIVLEGKENAIALPFDSTVFIYSEEYKRLLRLCFFEGVQLYDELLITDELDQHKLFFWKVLTHSSYNTNPVTGMTVSIPVNGIEDIRGARPVWEWVDDDVYPKLRKSEFYYMPDGKRIIRIRKWKDIPDHVSMDPYIVELGKKLYKNTPQDISFAIMFSNASDKLHFVPFFDTIQIFLGSGEFREGMGYIQPAFYSEIKVSGLIHLFDGSSFTLYDPSDIDSVYFHHQWHYPIWDNFCLKFVIGTPWTHKSKTYMIVEEGLDQKSFFNCPNDLSFRIYTTRNGEKWSWVIDEVLEKDYLEYLETITDPQ